MFHSINGVVCHLWYPHGSSVVIFWLLWNKMLENDTSTFHLPQSHPLGSCESNRSPLHPLGSCESNLECSKMIFQLLIVWQGNFTIVQQRDSTNSRFTLVRNDPHIHQWLKVIMIPLVTSHEALNGVFQLDDSTITWSWIISISNLVWSLRQLFSIRFVIP